MVPGDTCFLLKHIPKKPEISFQRKIGEGSLMRQMKARESGFLMPYQRTISDPPLEHYFGFFWSHGMFRFQERIRKLKRPPIENGILEKVRCRGKWKLVTQAFRCRINEPSPILRWKVFSGNFHPFLEAKNSMASKKTEITFQRRIGDGSLIRHRKAWFTSFHLPHQRTLADLPLETYLEFFSELVQIKTGLPG